jgi:hypothetical protein
MKREGAKKKGSSAKSVGGVRAKVKAMSRRDRLFRKQPGFFSVQHVLNPILSHQKPSAHGFRDGVPTEV